MKPFISAHKPEDEPELPYWRRDFALAQLAAPFAAAGMTDAQAVERAYRLLGAAGNFLEGITLRELGEDMDIMFTLNLEGVLTQLKLKSRDRVRELLFEIAPASLAEATWQKALRGEKAFPRHMWSAMLDRKNAAISQRNAKAAQKREESRRKRVE